MAKQTTIAWVLLGGLALLAGWWGLVPKIGTATEAEVRAHVAPELLQPLPHPEGGVERFEALQRALDKLPAEFNLVRKRCIRTQLELTDPAVSEVIEILRAGPIDRIREIPLRRQPISFWDVAASRSNIYSPVTRVSNDLAAAALRVAAEGDWARAGQHMDAICLLLDRLFESDALLQDRRWTVAIEKNAYQTALGLAVLPDFPAVLAERLNAQLVKDRHDPASLLRVLQGEMQLMLLKRIGELPISIYAAGTYDPLETAELLSARFLEFAREAGLPAVRRTSLSDIEGLARQSELTPERWVFTSSRAYRNRDSYLSWPLRRIRLNTSRNSIGHIDAVAYPDGGLMDRTLDARSRQDRVAAALAVVRFRQRAGRDPRDYAELVANGMLRAAPMDHRTDTPLPFDLKALFEQPAPRRN